MILNLIYQGSGRRPLLAILPEKVNHDFYSKWFRRGGNLRLSWSLIQCLREKEGARSSHLFVVLSEGYLRNADAWVSSLKFLHMLKYPHPPSTQCAIFALNSHSYGPYASTIMIFSFTTRYPTCLSSCKLRQLARSSIQYVRCISTFILSGNASHLAAVLSATSLF
jgi:hypothetical protein